MISSIKPVGPRRQQGGKCLRLFGFLILIIPAVNIIKVSVNIKQYGLYKDVYEYSFGEPQDVVDQSAAKTSLLRHRPSSDFWDNIHLPSPNTSLPPVSIGACCGIGHRLTSGSGIPSFVYAISNLRIVHVSWDDVQWNVLFNDTMQIKQGPRADEHYDYGLPTNWTTSSLAWTETMESKWNNGWGEQIASSAYNDYGVMGGVPKMLMEMPLAQTIVKSLAMNMSPLVLSFLDPIREQIIDSDLHVCTHVREGNGEFDGSSYSERMMASYSSVLNSTLVAMTNYVMSRNTSSKVSVFVASDTLSASSWFEKNIPANWKMVMPGKVPRRPSVGHWFEWGKVTNLTKDETDEAMAEAVADVFALGECDALYIPKYSSFNVVGIMLARADGRNVYFLGTKVPAETNSTEDVLNFIEYPEDKFINK